MICKSRDTQLVSLFLFGLILTAFMNHVICEEDSSTPSSTQDDDDDEEMGPIQGSFPQILPGGGQSGFNYQGLGAARDYTRSKMGSVTSSLAGNRHQADCLCDCSVTPPRKVTSSQSGVRSQLGSALFPEQQRPRPRPTSVDSAAIPEIIEELRSAAEQQKLMRETIIGLGTRLSALESIFIQFMEQKPVQEPLGG